jgi:hypothetical protein
MWEEFEEGYENPYTGTVYPPMTWIRREDGFKLLSIGIGREGHQTFVCRGKFGEFKFYARRWHGDIFKGSEIDTYTVILYMVPDVGMVDKETIRKLVLAHAKEIESGLLVYPLNSYKTSVKQVVFDIGRDYKFPKLVRAEEISK